MTLSDVINEITIILLTKAAQNEFALSYHRLYFLAVIYATTIVLLTMKINQTIST